MITIVVCTLYSLHDNTLNSLTFDSRSMHFFLSRKIIRQQCLIFYFTAFHTFFSVTYRRCWLFKYLRMDSQLCIFFSGENWLNLYKQLSVNLPYRLPTGTNYIRKLVKKSCLFCSVWGRYLLSLSPSVYRDCSMES